MLDNPRAGHVCRIPLHCYLLLLGYFAGLIVFASRIPPRLLRTRGLVAKCCAVPVWRPSFVLILGHWPHIGPVPGATLGCLWGPGGLPTGARGPPRDNPDDPNHVLGVPLGCLWGPGGLPRGAGSLQETTQATKMGLPPQRRAGFLKTPKHDEH